ncbi:type II restriction endonuclease [Bacteroides ovatus]|nr:type II restriction endonuclease [Akkermansia muciniphila]KAA4212605.1 type II restriction endonuclease [Bacteroides ovatus]
MSDFVQQQDCICDFSSSDSWVILSPIEQSIKHKIEAVGTPLKDWDINIYRGVLTGYNDAFIISTEKRDEILSNCQSEEERIKTAELIRPILRGRDIKRYGYEWANLYLIATFPSRHYNIEEYPAVKRYLLSFGKERLEQTGKTYTINGEKIKARKKTNNKWFETQDSISYWEDFNKPKIVWGNLNLKGAYSYAPEGMFINAPSPFLATSNIAVLHILNSKIADYYIRSLGVTRNGGYFEYKPMFVERLPIPQIGLENLNSYPIKPSKEQEKEIEENVYQIYGLSLQEIDYMENRED